MLQLLLCKDGVFIHVTTAQADEDVLLPGQVFIWNRVQWHTILYTLRVVDVTAG